MTTSNTKVDIRAIITYGQIDAPFSNAIFVEVCLVFAWKAMARSCPNVYAKQTTRWEQLVGHFNSVWRKCRHAAFAVGRSLVVTMDKKRESHSSIGFMSVEPLSRNMMKVMANRYPLDDPINKPRPDRTGRRMGGCLDLGIITHMYTP